MEATRVKTDGNRSAAVLHGVFHHCKYHTIEDTSVFAEVALEVRVQNIDVGPSAIVDQGIDLHLSNQLERPGNCRPR